MIDATLLQNLENYTESGASWNVRPFQLVSPLDMQPFLADIFYFLEHSLEPFECEVNAAIRERGKESPLTENERGRIDSSLSAMKHQCERTGLERALERTQDIINEPYSAGDLVSLGRMRTQLHELRRAISRDLRKQLFMSIPASDVGKYEQPKLFGPQVHRKFKSTRLDVKEAGNCYAVGRYTACVFHCMRVLEKGLHALVHEINAKHNAGIVFTPRIEAKNWGEILGKIDQALKESNKQNLIPQPAKADYRFYSKATIHFEHFLRAWRNDVSHARKHYSESEAQEVINHVEGFMKQIVTRLTELPKTADNPLPEN